MSRFFPLGVEVCSKLTRGVPNAAQIASDGFGPTRAVHTGMSRQLAGTAMLTADVGNLQMDSDFEQVGERITFGARRKTLKVAGDGSATTMILMEALLGTELLDGLRSGIDPDRVRRGIKKAVGDMPRSSRPCRFRSRRRSC